MKTVLGFVLAGSLLAACGGGAKSSTNSTTTAAGQKTSHPNNDAPDPDAKAIDRTPFNK